MAAGIQSAPDGSKFIDRFLAFFAGAAIALWFIGGLSESSLESLTLAGPETHLAAAYSPESATMLTRFSEELIYQVATTFQPGTQALPFASINEDGHIRELSLQSLTELKACIVETDEGTGVSIGSHGRTKSRPRLAKGYVKPNGIESDASGQTEISIGAKIDSALSPVSTSDPGLSQTSRTRAGPPHTRILAA